MSSEALREKLKISVTKTTLSMLHVMSCFPPQEALTFFKTQFEKCECVSDKSCVKGTDPLLSRTQWQSQLYRKVSLCQRSLAAASTSIHSISIQARGGCVVSFFIQHPGNHPTMWMSRMLESVSKLFLPFVSNVWFSEACKSHISYTPII